MSNIKKIPLFLKDDQLAINGISAITPLNTYDSPSRLAMLTAHLRQCLDLIHSDVNLLSSGIELDLAQHCFNVSTEYNMKVLYTVPRYESLALFGHGKVIEYTVIYQDIDTGEYGHLVLKNFVSNSPSFGTELLPTAAVNQIAKDKYFEKGTVFMKPECCKDSGNFGIGANTNIAFMGLAPTAEDGYWVDDWWQDRFKFNAYQTVNEDLQNGHVLTNTYGDENTIKVLPTVGDRIRADGVVFNIRKIDPLTAGLSLSNRWLGKIIQKYDRPFYVPYIGAEVIDIVVVKTSEHNDLPVALRAQLDALARATLDYRTTLLEFEMEIYRKHKEAYGTNAKPVFKADFSRLLVESRAIFAIGASDLPEDQIKRLAVLVPNFNRGGKLKLNRKQKGLGPYSISITLKYQERPTLGYKLTNFHGKPV